MSIRVTCTGCHTRFDVSEKFAGKEGPCPKCKKTILIPAKSEKVEVHSKQEFGPTTTSGQAVFKPISRKETRLSAVQMVLIGATIVGFLAMAFMVRLSVDDKESFNTWALIVGAILLAVPCVYAGYAFLRNSDLGAFEGQELWGRIAACSVCYGLSWLAIPVISYAVGPEIGRFAGVGLMMAAGACLAYLLLGVDVFMGVLHFGMFLGCCVLWRVIAGFTALPIPKEAENNRMEDILSDPGTGACLESWFEALAMLF